MQLIEVKEVLAYLCYGGNIDGNVRDDSKLNMSYMKIEAC
jgi:hypothetical protein